MMVTVSVYRSPSIAELALQQQFLPQVSLSTGLGTHDSTSWSAHTSECTWPRSLHAIAFESRVLMKMGIHRTYIGHESQTSTYSGQLSANQSGALQA